MTPDPDNAHVEQSPEAVAAFIEARARLKQIGKVLISRFDAVAAEPVPPEFLALLDRIDRRAKSKTRLREM